jgi:transcriptional regulator with XRE-family HTH domain
MAALAAAPRGSQTSIARELGVAVTTVNKWAQGHNVPEPSRWQDVERLLGMPEGSLARAAGISQGRSLDDLLGLIESVAARVDRIERRLGPDDPLSGRADEGGFPP